MSVSTYCSIGGHGRCPGGACSCSCHSGITPPAQARGSAMPTSVECPFCHKMIGNQAGLQSHLRSMHPASQNPDGTHAAVDAPPSTSGDALVWEEPPPAGRMSVGRKLAPLIVHLRRRPGEWARLVTYDSKSAASTARKKLVVAFPDCEFNAARLGDGSAIWARFVEEA